MTFLQSLFLGAVQGLTEFLPISSSGHLVFFQRVFGIAEETLAFDIAVHIATLVAVIAVFWKEIWYMIRKPFSKITLLIAVSIIPTAVIGFSFRDFFKYAFSSGAFLGISFILTGIILFYADRSRERTRYGKDSASMSFADAVFMGLAQGASIIPALSRSGLTISAGLFRGLNKEFAFKFSFLMSIPAIIGSALFDIRDISDKVINGTETISLIAGMMAAGITGYFAIRFMLDFFSRASLKVFSYYVILLGTFIVMDQLFFGMFFSKI